VNKFVLNTKIRRKKQKKVSFYYTHTLDKCFGIMMRILSGKLWSKNKKNKQKLEKSICDLEIQFFLMLN
jgi:hypothetical protein